MTLPDNIALWGLAEFLDKILGLLGPPSGSRLRVVSSPVRDKILFESRAKLFESEGRGEKKIQVPASVEIDVDEVLSSPQLLAIYRRQCALPEGTSSHEEVYEARANERDLIRTVQDYFRPEVVRLFWSKKPERKNAYPETKWSATFDINQFKFTFWDREFDPDLFRKFQDLLKVEENGELVPSYESRNKGQYTVFAFSTGSIS